MANFKSGVAVKPGDSGVVIGYQVYEFTHSWSVGCFVAEVDIYHGFTGKVLTLTHFPLESGCEDYSFLDQTVEDIEHDLHSFLTDYQNTRTGCIP